MGCAGDKTGEAWSAFQLVAAYRGERLNGEPGLGSRGCHFTSWVSIFSCTNPQRAGQDQSFLHYVWNTLGNANDIWILRGMREE